MEELVLWHDMKVYAEIMAEALAVMHWSVGIDANDVEFVLAPPPSCQGVSKETTNALGTHIMWVLDSDFCKEMPMDEKGIQQAVTAFYRNDPDYPRPRSSPLLWNVFREQYLDSSQKMAGVTEVDQRVLLSNMFIKAVEGREAVSRREQLKVKRHRVLAQKLVGS